MPFAVYFIKSLVGLLSDKVSVISRKSYIIILWLLSRHYVLNVGKLSVCIGKLLVLYAAYHFCQRIDTVL